MHIYIMRKCSGCNELIYYSSSRDLCDKCLASLSFVCVSCGKTVFNVEMKQKCRFLVKKTCSKECQYNIHKNIMLNNNPMNNPIISKKVGETQRKNHNSNPQYWKRKYVEAKFKHWVNLANGVSTNPQKHNSNDSSVDFFVKLQKIFDWDNDESYFEYHPYEFPLIISEKHKICFFPDYYNKTRNLIIEWDERYHNSKKCKTKDKRRDSLILNKIPKILIIRLPENSFNSDEERVEYIEEKLSGRYI